jgi:LysR family transcriptional regulator, transcriptional activator of nhaA
MDLNFNHLRNFHRVATAGSLVEAARKLDMSPSTLSEQIRSLERHLGVQLFLRTASGLKLSEAGRRLTEQTQVIWAAGERIQSGLESDEADLRVRLEVGIARTITHTFATRALRSLFEQDRAFVSATHGDLGDLVRRLVNGEFDLVLSDSRPVDDVNGKLVVESAGVSPLTAVVPRRLVGDTIPNMEQLSDVPFVHYTPMCALRWPVEQFLAQGGLSPKVLAEVDDVTLMCEVASLAGAWCIVPQLAPCASAPLDTVMRLGDGFVAEMHVLYQAQNKTEIVKGIVDSLQKSLAANLN